MNPEQQLEKIREQNRIRSKRFYDNNQAKILKKRADDKLECTKAKAKCNETKCECEVKSVKNNSKKILSHEESVSQLKESIDNENSKKFYDNNIKTLAYILDCDDFNKCLKASKQVIYKIESAYQKKDPTKLYSINSKKAIYQSILKMIDGLGIRISKNARDKYTNRFEIMNATSHEQTKHKMQTEQVMDFEQYLKLVKDKFGEVSKEYIIALLYNLSGFRDDLILKVVPRKPKEPNENYLIVSPNANHNLIIELNQYKTADKYGQDIIKIPRDLSKLLRLYMFNNTIVYGDYLFGKKSLSSFIKKFNEKLGLNISINKLRQMRVSNVLNNNPSIEDRVKLAKEMHHKTTTSDKYQRKTKNIIV